MDNKYTTEIDDDEVKDALEWLTEFEFRGDDADEERKLLVRLRTKTREQAAEIDEFKDTRERYERVWRDELKKSAKIIAEQAAEIERLGNTVNTEDLHHEIVALLNRAELAERQRDSLLGVIRSIQEYASDDDELSDNIDKEVACAMSITTCEHEWVDARNQVVKSGEICLKCGAGRAGNTTTTTGEK